MKHEGSGDKCHRKRPVLVEGDRPPSDVELELHDSGTESDEDKMDIVMNAQKLLVPTLSTKQAAKAPAFCSLKIKQ